MVAELGSPDDLGALGMRFTAPGSDGRPAALVPGGRDLPVTWEGRAEYLRMARAFRLHELAYSDAHGICVNPTFASSNQKPGVAVMRSSRPIRSLKSRILALKAKIRCSRIVSKVNQRNSRTFVFDF